MKEKSTESRTIQEARRALKELCENLEREGILLRVVHFHRDGVEETLNVRMTYDEYEPKEEQL